MPTQNISQQQLNLLNNHQKIIELVFNLRTYSFALMSLCICAKPGSEITMTHEGISSLFIVVLHYAEQLDSLLEGKDNDR